MKTLKMIFLFEKWNCFEWMLSEWSFSNEVVNSYLFIWEMEKYIKIKKVSLKRTSTTCLFSSASLLTRTLPVARKLFMFLHHHRGNDDDDHGANGVDGDDNAMVLMMMTMPMVLMMMMTMVSKRDCSEALI